MGRSLCIALFALLACNGDPVDTDGDGLDDDQEAELGTDPALADTDGDGLDDGAEVNTHNTSPTAADSDSDGYGDGDEVDAGTDPNDAESVIYAGGWPYSRDKESFGEPTSTQATAGAALPRLVMEDQYGDQVDLYDFAGSGESLVIMLAGMNCSTCFQVAGALKGSTTSLSADDKATLKCIGDAIPSQDVGWVVALYANSSGTTATSSDLTAWEAVAAVDGVPVLLDDLSLRNWFSAADTPAFVVIDPQTMQVTTATTTDISALQGVCTAVGG